MLPRHFGKRLEIPENGFIEEFPFSSYFMPGLEAHLYPVTAVDQATTIQIAAVRLQDNTSFRSST